MVLISSCSSIMLSIAGANAKVVKPRYLNSEYKEIVFVPMHHVGKSEFYESVYDLTDSLSKVGFKVYYESIRPLVPSDTSFNIFNYRKLRKLMSRQLPKGGHIDTVTYKISGRIKVDRSYINQPQPNELISMNSMQKNVDVSLDDIIKEYESRHGLIELDSCDLNTDIYNEYNCLGLRDIEKEKYREFKNDIIINYRDKYLAEFVANSKDSKIIIIYGRAHYDGFVRELKKLNSSWQEQ